MDSPLGHASFSCLGLIHTGLAECGLLSKIRLVSRCQSVPLQMDLLQKGAFTPNVSLKCIARSPKHLPLSEAYDL